LSEEPPPISIDDFLEKSNFFNYGSILPSVRSEIISFYQSLVANGDVQSKHNLVLERGIFDKKSKYLPLPIVEIGGTNLNVSIVNLGSKDLILEYDSSYVFEENKLTIKYLFDKIYGILQSIVEDEYYTKFAQIRSILEIKQIGIVLAFPISYKYYDDGKFGSILTSHSKEIDVSEVINKDLTLELKNHWKAKLGTDIDIIIVNDAIASVLCLKYLNTLNGNNYNILINVIVGTGFNVAFEAKTKSTIRFINSESGFLPILNLKGLTEFDKYVNQQSMLSANYVEQMISGKYIPILLNHILGMITNEIPQFASLEEYIEFIEIDHNIPKSNATKAVERLTECILERGSEIVSEALLGVINVLKKDRNIETPKVRFLFEGSVLNKTILRNFLADNLRLKFDSVEQLQIIDNIVSDQNIVTTRFSSIGVAYLLSKLF
jgi:hexokinase